jgi:dual specificity phosphatase 12
MYGYDVKFEESCRVLLIGSNKVRLSKILSLLLLRHNPKRLRDNISISVEYLPCVASFGSYKDESGTNIRYLERIDYFPYDCNCVLAVNSSSLLPYFDDNDESNTPIFPRISGVAIGCGIEGSDDTARITSFVTTMVSQSSSSKYGSAKIRTIEPNPDFHTIKEELAAFKQLSPSEKEEANRLGTMGPEKMVNFIIDFTNELIQDALDNAQALADLPNETNTSSPLESMPAQTVLHTAPRTFDSSEDRFLCRMCRITLFGGGDLQDPPHESSKHRFSHRKLNHGAVSSHSMETCQSYFLQDCLEWMGHDIRNGVAEGKLNCPKCDAKIGTWIWSGTQCSCGTWVVPAIQIPKSKVDILLAPKLA